jgi:hypothetical protein
MFGLLDFMQFMCFDWHVYIIDEWLLPYFFKRWLCMVMGCLLKHRLFSFFDRYIFCDLVHRFLIYIHDTVDSISLCKPCIWDLLLLLCHEWPWFCFLILHRYKFIYFWIRWLHFFLLGIFMFHYAYCIWLLVVNVIHVFVEIQLKTRKLFCFTVLIDANKWCSIYFYFFLNRSQKYWEILSFFYCYRYL